MAFPSIRINIGADMSKLKRDLDKGEGIVKSFGKAASRAMEGAVLAAGAFATKLAIDGVKAASDLNETISKTNVIFGDSAKTIQNWAEQNAVAMGQTRQQALDAAATFAIFGKQAGYTGDQLVNFSSRFTTLASDMASFSNTSPDEAIQALGAALRGESEPIRKYGVLLSDAAIQQKAFNDEEIAGNKRYFSMQGKKEVLNDQGKLLARYKLILEQTSDAQGDFARTSDGLANGQRVLNATWDEAQVKIGEALLPAIQDLVKWANSNEGKRFIDDFAGAMRDAFKTAADALPVILNSLKDIGKAASGMGIDFKSFMSPEFLAAGAAFVATPGPIQLKGLAAIAAYYAAKDATMQQSERQVRKASNLLAGSQITGGGFMYAPESDSFVDFTGRRRSRQEIAGLQAGLTRAQNMQGVVNVIVNGAVDPQQTAVAVQRSIAKANRMRVGNNNAPATGF